VITLGIGFLGIVFREERRGWEDRFSGTDVVYDERRPEPAPWSAPPPKSLIAEADVVEPPEVVAAAAVEAEDAAPQAPAAS